MRLAFIVAIEEELAINKKQWKLKKINNINYYFTKVNNNEFILIFSKVGKANAANITSLLINSLKVNNIINIGTVGLCNNQLTSHDLCIVQQAYYSDVDATCFKYKINQIPQEQLFFTTSKKLNKLIETIIKNKFKFKIHNDIELATADSFITSKNRKKFHIFNSTDIVDMEGASILQIANHYNNINVSMIKFISDNISNKNNTKEYDNSLLSVRANINKIIDEIINNV